MIKTAIAALMMAFALAACNKSANTPSTSSSDSAGSTAGLSQLGGNTKK
jgi:hypothetical protein